MFGPHLQGIPHETVARPDYAESSRWTCSDTYAIYTLINGMCQNIHTPGTLSAIRCAPNRFPVWWTQLPILSVTILEYTHEAFAITGADPTRKKTMASTPPKLILFKVLLRTRTAVRDRFVVFFFRMLAVRLSVATDSSAAAAIGVARKKPLLRCMLFVGCRSSHGRTDYMSVKTKNVQDYERNGRSASPISLPRAESFVPTNRRSIVAKRTDSEDAHLMYPSHVPQGHHIHMCRHNPADAVIGRVDIEQGDGVFVACGSFESSRAPDTFPAATDRTYLYTDNASKPTNERTSDRHKFRPVSNYTYTPYRRGQFYSLSAGDPAL
ncbi:hypothetical protein CBL_07986 [Carabus blaptoides fortunei]